MANDQNELYSNYPIEFRVVNALFKFILQISKK